MGPFLMPEETLIPHLFRTEYQKIVAVLCKRFGFDQIEIAEDISSETFLAAAQSWPIHGLPENPVAWLYQVAKNKAKNYLIRQGLFEKKISPDLKLSHVPEEMQDIDLSSQNIFDSQLQMMFAICHPSLSPEGQIGLSLRILCGFGIEEIADAFLTNKEVINKRLFRAKEKLREERIAIEMPDPSAMDERHASVLRTLYLLFSEGYYSVSQNKNLRKELCWDAMRLCNMLIENKETNRPESNALMALMCFHASRFEAREDEEGELILYDEQDKSLWDDALVSRGAQFLKNASTGNELSKYHLEAGIAYWYTVREDKKEKWENILQLYNKLLQLHYSPIAALNRTYALSKANGNEEAIVEAEKLKLTENHLYHSLLGELYKQIDKEKSLSHFRTAWDLAKSDPDKTVIRKKIYNLEKGNSKKDC